MKIVFIGTPQISVHYLKYLQKEHEVKLVVTQSAKASGRGLGVKESAVARYCAEQDIEIYETDDINSDASINKIRESGAEIGVVVAFGQLIKSKVRELLPHQFINLHFSLLPQFRGADPVAAAIRLKKNKTGVTIFQITDELDAGDVYTQLSIEIDKNETTAGLFEKLIPLGEIGLRESLEKIAKNISPIAQSGTTSYAPKSTKTDYRISWSESAEDIYSLIRSGFEKKLAWTTFNGQNIKISRASISQRLLAEPIGTGVIDQSLLVKTGDGVIEIEQLQPEGKRPMLAMDWARGLRQARVIFK